MGLIITAANIYFELDNKEAFKLAMSEAIEPNNPVLYYNLGVVSGELGSCSFFMKNLLNWILVMKIALNLVALILDGEQDCK